MFPLILLAGVPCTLIIALVRASVLLGVGTERYFAGKCRRHGDGTRARERKPSLRWSSATKGPRRGQRASRTKSEEPSNRRGMQREHTHAAAGEPQAILLSCRLSDGLRQQLAPAVSKQVVIHRNLS